MNNTATNSLGYTGIVTLSQYIGNKKKIVARSHNRGQHSLFDFFSNCLVGDFATAEYALPAKIRLLNVVDSVYEPISSFVYLRTPPEKLYDATAGVVKYSFILPRDVLEDAKFSQLGVGLYTAAETDPGEFLAFCTIDDLTVGEVSTTSILVLDWELRISNASGND